MVNGVKKYTGLVQTLRLVITEEGARSLHGGLSAHLTRVVPNAAVIFWVYKGILRWDKNWLLVQLLRFLFTYILPPAAFIHPSLYHTPSTIVSKLPVYLLVI